jgi:hypothetical protein
MYQSHSTARYGRRHHCGRLSPPLPVGGRIATTAPLSPSSPSVRDEDAHDCTRSATTATSLNTRQARSKPGWRRAQQGTQRLAARRGDAALRSHGRREEETREECAEVRRQAVLACCNFWAYRLKFYMGHWLINHWIANFCLSQGRHSPCWPTCSTSEPEYPIMPQGPGSDSVPYLVSGTVDSSIDPNLTVTVH